MGGPWRARDFDPAAWRPPAAQAIAQTARPDRTDPAFRDRLTWVAVGYVASVITSFAVTVTLLKLGW
jgi:hypothetical protein